LAFLAAGCAGGSGERASKPAAATHAQKQTPARVAKPRVRGVGKPVRAARPSRPKKSTSKKPVSRVAKPKPRQREPQRALPWQADGTSLVAHVRVRRLAVYRAPGSRRAALTLGRRDPHGTQRAFLVRGARGDWVHVYLPTRPNGSEGWVRRHTVRMYTNGYRLVVRLRAHRLALWRGSRLLASYPVAVGTRSTPTPRGLYYVVELLRPSDPKGSYGPFSFGLSAHSNVLKRFAGGDGRVGLHGTNQPGLIGSDVSHGCIRLRNGAIRRLARILPLGTPVYIRA